MASPLDELPAVIRFRELLRIPTVSHADEALTDWVRFEEFAEALARLYPLAHERLEREVIAGHSLLYRWPGREAGSPTVLMAHMDVVAVIDAEWEHPPFGATIVGDGSDAAIHARGAIDDKGALVAILEAVEEALTDGVAPRHDLYLSFGHNEETSGEGARAIVELLRERGIRPALVLDEGGAVADGLFPGVTVPTAMIGVTERGVASLQLTAGELGGHASTPPVWPATARLARAIVRLRARPFPTRLTPAVRAMLATVAPSGPPALRWVFTHTRTLGPLLARVLARVGPEMNALVRTTAVVTELAGAPGANVLATNARATVNIRLLQGDTVASAVEHVRRAVADPKVDVAILHGTDPSPVSPWRGEAWARLAVAVRSTLGAEVVPTPYVQLGASDSRWFTAIGAHVYRFTPFHLTRAEREALHSHNERIRVEVWLRGIGFYKALISAS